MVEISAVVASAFIGALATGLITLLVRELRGVLNNRRDRERFREALIGEIEAGKINVGEANSISDIGGDMVPSNVYKGDISKLGYLNEDEIRSITRYYASAEKINAIANRIALHHKEVEQYDEHGESRISGAYYDERRHLIKRAEESIEVLNENKSQIGLKAYVKDSIDVLFQRIAGG